MGLTGSRIADRNCLDSIISNGKKANEGTQCSTPSNPPKMSRKIFVGGGQAQQNGS